MEKNTSYLQQEKNNAEPLISLIVRTVNRPELPEALACIGRQTYGNIEIIVVDALGKNQLLINDVYGEFPVQIISKNKHLSIPEAANAGLDVVKGAFFGFLDEDDLIDENHVNDLFKCLKNSDAIAAYSSITMVDRNGIFMQNFDEDYSLERLLLSNFIPVHALLFRSKVLKLGCRPDETLKIYDDWDFLLQIAQHGKFVHLNQTTGIYRNFRTSGAQHDDEMIKCHRKKIYARWKEKLTSEQFYNFIEYLLLNYGKQTVSEKEKQIDSLIIKLREEHKRYIELTEELVKVNDDLKAIQSSLSWRVTAPLRKTALLFRHFFHT